MSVHFVSDVGGDWKGVYVDGVLVAEGHSLREEEVLDALDIDYTETHDWNGEDYGRLPNTLEEALTQR